MLSTRNGAVAAWPRKLPGDADEERKRKHRPEPELALDYFKRADSYSPFNSIIQKGMADAEAMLEQQG